MKYLKLPSTNLQKHNINNNLFMHHQIIIEQLGQLLCMPTLQFTLFNSGKIKLRTKPNIGL